MKPDFKTIVKILIDYENHVDDKNDRDVFYENLRKIINASMYRLTNFPLPLETVNKHLTRMFDEADKGQREFEDK